MKSVMEIFMSLQAIPDIYLFFVLGYLIYDKVSKYDYDKLNKYLH